MTMWAIVCGAMGLTGLLVVWDAIRRGLASQERMAELRVGEAEQASMADLSARLASLGLRVDHIDSELSSTRSAVTMGTRRR